MLINQLEAIIISHWSSFVFTDYAVYSCAFNLAIQTMLLLLFFSRCLVKNIRLKLMVCHFSRSVPLCSRGWTPRHPEAVQPQRQHNQHLPESGAQQPELLLQAGGGGLRLQQ